MATQLRPVPENWSSAGWAVREKWPVRGDRRRCPLVGVAAALDYAIRCRL